MSNSQAHLSTVVGNDDDDTQGTVEDLFGSLDIAERKRDSTAVSERMKRNVDASKASKLREGTANIDEYLKDAEDRLKMGDRDAEFRADWDEATRRSLEDIPGFSPSADARVPSGLAKAKKSSPGLFSNLRSNISALASPYLKSPLGRPDDNVADITDETVTPRSGLTQHANNLHDSLMRPLEDTMAFSPQPTQVGNNVTASTGNTVRFRSEDDVQPRFQFGSESPYPNFDAGITAKSSFRSKSPVTIANSSVTSPATFAHSSDTSPATFAHSSDTSPATFAHPSVTSPATFAHPSVTSPATYCHPNIDYKFAQSTVPRPTTFEQTQVPFPATSAHSSVPVHDPATSVHSSVHSSVPSPATNAHIPYGYVHPAYNVQNPNYNGYPVYQDAPRYAQHVPGTDAMNANHSTLSQELRTTNPPRYQHTSPGILQEKHPHDVPSSGPGLISNQDYEEALIRGVAERSPIVAYRASYVEQPSQPAMSNTAGPFTQNLIPNPHYSATAAAQAYARMHPNENAAELALAFRSPNGPNPTYNTNGGTPHTTNTNATRPPHGPNPTYSMNGGTPHTTTTNATNGGYGPPGYGPPGYRPLPPPRQATQARHASPAPLMNLVPPTPYAHNNSLAYENQSEATSLGTSVRGIKYRSSVTRRDLNWKGDAASFHKYLSKLFGIMQQNGTHYLGNGDFLTQYLQGSEYLSCGIFWDQFGIRAQQAMADNSWLMGVFMVTIDDADNIPELTSARGDGVIALVNLMRVYSNNGESDQDTRWKVHDEINRIYNPSTVTLTDFIRNFQTNILKHQRYHPAFGRNDVLDLLKKNMIDAVPMLDYHFDIVSNRTDPWVAEIQYLVSKIPKQFRKKTLRSPTGLFPTHLNTVETTSDQPRVHQVETMQELKEMVTKVFNAFTDRYTSEFSEYPEYDALRSVYAVFKNDPGRVNLSIPTPLWMRLDDTMKKQIVRIRQEIRDEKNSKEKSKEKGTPIGKQYPSLNKPPTDMRQTMAALTLIQNIAVSDLFDDEDSVGDDMDTTNEILDSFRHIKMASQYGEFWDDDDTIDIKANFRYAMKCFQDGLLFAISDGGADSCILGKSAKLINSTGRYARLVGYDPETTQSARVPIVSAYLKTKDDAGNYILLLIHEAPYLAHSSTTLLSEYQIREYGLVIDSCSKNHIISSNPRLTGKQRFEIATDTYVRMEDRGAIMGIPIYHYEDGDDELYPIHEITSKATWIPYRYRIDKISGEVSTSSTMDSKIPITAAAAAATVVSTAADVAHVASISANVETAPDSKMPVLLQKSNEESSSDEDSDTYRDMPPLTQRCDDDSSSDDDSISYQKELIQVGDITDFLQGRS